MAIGQDLLAVPFGDMLASIAKAIVECAEATRPEHGGDIGRGAEGGERGDAARLASPREWPR